ncbi:retinitis pigmentosa 1-like 1 protein [Periophthalmus magnuspinnatus]|uniref:retinitis pigmentosa 1-like 1 protein n=1 Tax=Periophthalmus magnuspinnatus TaxID=409849 RepID=UPI00243701D8|nr:retinitis pigmentosa 1-like 1 protein [Periophthalmus magnuspinnatus]
MQSVQAGKWDPPSKQHATPLAQPHQPQTRPSHVNAPQAKRITFYKSGDSQFGGVKMAVHKRSFKCFDALLDDLSQKVPLPFGVRTVTTPRGTHTIRHLEQLQDGGCYLCSDRRQAKPINMDITTKRSGVWSHHGRRPHRPESTSATPPGHVPYRQRRLLLVKNTEPAMRRSVVLSRRVTRSLRAFLEEASDVMQFHVRKLYTVEGRKIDNVQSLMTCPNVLVCVGREAFSPLLVNYIRKSSDEKLPGLETRTPGNGARSPPQGAQSRASEHSEGQDSKKNMLNFGLETKKSIIHPRSNSSNRSARFSMSSEKSCGLSTASQGHAAILNDDIEKRVIVNKDGSLSVEMKVRFRLHSDETLQWSTQIKKSPSLTNDCCSTSQAQSHYLQHESCSDPDCNSYEPEIADYSSQCAMDTNMCPCCYRQGQQYDLWKNPTHSHKQPIPPSHSTTESHTILRQTHSSSSTSSCNSTRVVRCRARITNCEDGSEHSQIVQEEMCVTEQHVVEQEVSTVSRSCSQSEVFANGDEVRPLSSKSGEEEVERPMSVISASSHVLQELKEDDDELPPSASRCDDAALETFEMQNDDRPASNASAKQNEEEEGSTCRCPSASGVEGNGRTSTAKSKAGSFKSTKEAANDDVEEVKTVVSGLSAGSRKSGTSLCSNCGGWKLKVASGCNSRASNRSNNKSPRPTTGNSAIDEDDNSSDVSTLSNTSNLTDHREVSMISNGDIRAASAMSKPEEEEQAKEARATSVTSNKSRKSGCENNETVEIRSPSVISALSENSNCSAVPDPIAREAADGDDASERVASAMSVKSSTSAKTKSSIKVTAPTTEEEETRSASVQSEKSNASAKSNRPDSTKSTKPEEQTRATSVQSVKSNESANTSRPASAKSHVSEKSQNAEEETRAASVLSVKSNKSRSASPMSVKSSKSEVSENELQNLEVKSNAKDQEGERAVSATSGKTHISTVSAKSKKSNQTVISINVNGENDNKSDRVTSPVSVKSNKSSRFHVITIKTPEVVSNDRSASSASNKTEKSNVSARSKQNKKAAVENDNGNEKILEDQATKSRNSNCTQELMPESTDLRGTSSLSVRSGKSGKSKCTCGETNKDIDDTKEDSEVAASIPSQKIDDADEDSFASVSLVLPDDQESESGESNVSSNRNKTKTSTPEVSKSPVNVADVGPTTPNATNIPTIETPGQGNNNEDASDEKSRVASSCSTKSTRSVKSTKSKKSCSNCGKLTTQEAANGTASPVGSVKSIATTRTGQLTAPDNRTTSAMSTASAKNQRKLAKNEDDDNASEESSEQASETKVEDDTLARTNSKSPSRLQPISGSTRSTNSSKVKNGALSAESSQKKEVNAKSQSTQNHSIPASKGDTCSESLLSHSLSAADLAKETKATERPESSRSKVNKSAMSQRSKKEAEQELTPSCLPNASPNEVVSDWLNRIPANMLALGDEDEDKCVEDVERGNGVGEEAEVKGEDEEVKTEVSEGEKAGAKEEGKVETFEIRQVGMVTETSLPKSWHSSAAVMKVLLSSSVGRCRSMPEVSPVYGRRLSASARQLLDCLTQLQLIEPTGNQGYSVQKDQRPQFEDIISILQSLWLAEPGEIVDPKDPNGTDQISPPRSSSGVDMSSGSGGSGKDNVNQEDEPRQDGEQENKTEEASESPDDAKATENPSSLDKNSKTPTDNDLDTQEDTQEGSSSESPPTVLKAPLSKRQSQDPDPMWVLRLLKKLEKQFINHYVTAMADFKVKWDLEDSLILDRMIVELKDEVSQRIERSVEREMKKIQGRAGKRVPRPPLGGNQSTDSVMTEKRRRLLKVMKNHSVKTGDSVSEGELTGENSDQRSDDEYCPCEACIAKKMASRPPPKTNPNAIQAPVHKDFDLLKILLFKTSPGTQKKTELQQEEAKKVVEEDGRNLEVVEEETSEDLGAEEAGAEEEGAEEGDAEEEGAEEEEAEEAKCQCQCSKDQDEEETEDSDRETVKERTSFKETTGETSGGEETRNEEGGEEEEDGGESEEEGEVEDDGEMSEEASTEERTSEQESRPAVSATEGEDADVEDSGTEEKSDHEAENKTENTEPKLEKKPDTSLLHQFTKTSVESQSGSLEDITTSTTNMEVRKLASPGGRSQKRSRSPARVKHRKAKNSDSDLDNV